MIGLEITHFVGIDNTPCFQHAANAAASVHYIYNIRCSTRCVAAPDSLKNEIVCYDHNILVNPAAKRPSATSSAIVHPLSVSDAESELSLKPREALERRKCRPLTTRAEHTPREVDLAIVIGRHMRQNDGRHCTTACTTIECNGPRLVHVLPLISIVLHMQPPLPCCGLRAHEAIMRCKPCGQHVNHACVHA